MRGGWLSDVMVGSLAGYGATLVMERAATKMYEAQSESSRQREEQLRTEMPTTTLVRKMGEAAGAKVSDDRAERLGMWAHYGFGTSGGPAAALLMRHGLGAVPAGVAVGVGMWVAVDEGANAVLGLTPPATEFPLVTHARALAAHLVYGLAVGALLGTARRVLGD